MANQKNYGLAGVGSEVQYGKKGGSVRYVLDADAGSGGTAPAFQIRNSTADGLLRLQAAAPVGPDDLTTKIYVDSAIQGLDLKASVKAATIDNENVPLAGAYPLSIDGYAVQDGDRLLLKNQTDAKQNGIYDIAVAGGATYTLTRSADADNEDIENNPSSEVSSGMFTFVEEGTLNGGTGWVLNQPAGTANLGTDSLVFVQFSTAGVITAGAGMNKVGQELSVRTDDVTIRINGTNNLAVKSSATSGQVLVSQGSADAAWGSVNLASTDAVSGTLAATSGGTGQNSYNIGDLLVGGASDTLVPLAIGANGSVLSVNSSGVLVYQYPSNLLDTNGLMLVEGLTTASAVNFLNVQNAATTNGVTIGTDGTDTDINLVFSPKGNGLLTAKAGYATWFVTNAATIGDDALAPKAFVDQRVDSIDTTRVQNAATTTYFATDLTGFSDRGMVGSMGKVLAEFASTTAEGVAVAGERFQFTHVTDEVQIKAVNTSGVGNVNIRLLPQAQGQVYIGDTGSGLIQGEAGFQLTVKGGDSTDTFDAGNLVLRGGDATSADFNGGNAIIRGGTNSGAGTRGTTIIQDDRQVNIVEFVSPANPAANWMEIQNAPQDSDPVNSAIIIRAAAASANGDVSILLDPKGNGLVRIGDESTYQAALDTSGQLDALVNKGWVAAQIADASRAAGTGLNDSSGSFNINIGANTISVDGSNNLIVKSSSTANQVLLSSGISGGEASWGGLPLNSAGAVSGILGIANGGTGLNSFVAGDLMIGTSSSTLTKLSKGPNNSILQVSNTGSLQWGYPTGLRDATGLPVANALGVSSAVNFLTMTNAALTGAVTIGSDGTDSNISIVLNPKGTGLVVGRTGYTASIDSNRETFVTKGYVDDALQFNTDPLMRRAVISSGFAAVMPIGLPTPNVSGRSVYINRVTFNVTSAVTGNSVAVARVTAGANEVMNFDENDIGQTSTYVADQPFSFTSTNTQVNVEFYQADGETPAIPTAGNITITAEYKIL